MTDDRTAAIQALWLEAFQQVAGRAAHEVKGALNGVCVNLEVVRSRATAQGTAPASSLSRFAQAAADQMDALISMNEALLALARRPRDVVDVLATARQLVTLLAPVAASDGGSLTLVEENGGAGATAAPAVVVRYILAVVLLRLLDSRMAVTTCRVSGGDNMVIRIEQHGGTRIAIDSAVTQVAAEFGVGVDVGSTGLSLAFPRAGRSSGRRSAPTRELA